MRTSGGVGWVETGETRVALMALIRTRVPFPRRGDMMKSAGFFMVRLWFELTGAGLAVV